MTAIRQEAFSFLLKSISSLSENSMCGITYILMLDYVGLLWINVNNAQI